MTRKTSIRDVAGAGPLGFGLCVLVFVTFWKIDIVAGTVSLYGDKVLHNVLAGVLLCAGGMVFYAALRAMPISKHSKSLVMHGVYSYIRHPRYAAVVFLVYPAFGLLVHSSLCLISTLAAYVIFRLSAVLEERKLIQIFGQNYKNYMKETPGFIPKLRRRQSPCKQFFVQSIKLGWTRCFLLKCTGGYLLIDTYYPKYYSRFERKLANLGIAISDIKYLLLTHHHDDHAGFAAELVRSSGCQIIAHRNAVSPLKQGKSEDTAKALNRRVQITFKFYEIFLFHQEYTYPPLTLTDRDIILEGDDESFLKEIGIDAIILHTPGHTNTRDSISVLLSDGNAFVGDAAMNFLWWTGIRHRPIAIGDINTIYESWRKLRERGARVIYPSHGKPFPATELAASQSMGLDKSD